MPGIRPRLAMGCPANTLRSPVKSMGGALLMAPPTPVVIDQVEDVGPLRRRLCCAGIQIQRNGEPATSSGPARRDEPA